MARRAGLGLTEGYYQNRKPISQIFERKDMLALQHCSISSATP